MARTILDEQARASGRRLGALLSSARKGRTQSDIGDSAGVRVDTLRKIERGAVSSPGFFVVGHLARALGLSLDEIYAAASERVGNDDD
jgi:transcriptional regulator with XRE-family HTH domain